MKSESIIFYGAGRYAEKILTDKKHSHESSSPLLSAGVCFVDGNVARHGDDFLGLPILSLDVALHKFSNASIFVSLSEPLKYEILYWLVYEKLIPAERIINYEPVCKRLSCFLLESSVVVLDNRLTFCCSDFGKNKAPYVDWNDNVKMSLRNLMQMRASIIDKLNNGESNPCSECPELRMVYAPKRYKVSLLSFSIMGICNCRCCYCDYDLRTYNSGKSAEDLLELLSAIQCYGVSNSFIVYVSPGEITIFPEREKIFQGLEKIDAIFFTNGLIYDEYIHKKLINGSGRILISLDCGTKNTFNKIKGVNAFDRVKNNLLKYSENRHRQSDVFFKYIFLPEVNDNQADVEGFIELCVELNAIAIISHNLRLAYDEYNNKKMMLAVRYMIRLLEEKNIKYDIISKNVIARLLTR